MGVQEFLSNSQKYLCTFQLFIDATKINFKKHNLFSLECIEWHLCSCELLAARTRTQAPLHKASLVVSQSSFEKQNSHPPSRQQTQAPG